MILYLTPDDFTNDFITVKHTPVKQVTFNKVKESFELAGRTISIAGYNIYAETLDVFGEVLSSAACTNIIGVSDAYISIASENTELLGTQLTEDNIAQCTVELYE